MRTGASSRARFWLLAGILAVAAAGKPILFDTLDPDCFWHLRVAAQLEHDGIRPLIDQLSFASDKTPWTAYSWLAELGMKRLWDGFGWRGAIAAHAMLNAAFVLLIALSCRLALRTDGLQDSRTLVAPAIITAIGAFVSLSYLSFRPATMAIVLLAMAMCMIQYDRLKNNRSRIIWLIVPLTALLANIHLFAFLVPLWFTFIMPTRATAGASSSEIAGGSCGHGTRTCALFGLTLLAACATPMLPGVLRTMAHYQFNDPMVAGPALAEMQPIWRGPFGLISTILLAVILLPTLTRFRRLGTTDLLLLALAVLLLVSKGRYAPLFVVTGAPVLARLWAWSRSEKREVQSEKELSTFNVQLSTPPSSLSPHHSPLIPATLAALLLAFLTRLLLAFPSSSTDVSAWLNRHGPDAPGYPTGAAAFVEQRIRPASGRLINEFTWGGYLSWRLPQFQTLMDGRTQCFSPDFWRQTCLAPPDRRKEFVQSIDADAAILPAHNSIFAQALLEHGWRPIHVDDRARVLVPPSSGSARAD